MCWFTACASDWRTRASASRPIAVLGMFWKPKKRLSLRGKVLAVLLPGIFAIIAVELWLTRLDAIDAANAAFDRSLLGTVRSVDMSVSTTAGGLAVELPYRLFEFFQLT